MNTSEISGFGNGGMGVVVAATHVHLGEQVALKFLLPEALDNPAARQFPSSLLLSHRVKRRSGKSMVSPEFTADSGIRHEAK